MVTFATLTRFVGPTGTRSILCGTGSELGRHWWRMASAMRVPYHMMPSAMLFENVTAQQRRGDSARVRPTQSAGAAVSMFWTRDTETRGALRRLCRSMRRCCSATPDARERSIDRPMIFEYLF